MFKTNLMTARDEQNELECLHNEMQNGDRQARNAPDQLTMGMQSFHVESDVGEYSCDKKHCISRTWNYCRGSVPLLLLIGYYVYVGFALYLNPSRSVLVCIIAVILTLICINLLTKRKFKRAVSRALYNFKNRVKPNDKRFSLWFRRVSTIIVAAAIVTLLVIDLWGDLGKWIPLGGLAVFVLLSVVFSNTQERYIPYAMSRFGVWMRSD